MTSPLPMSEKRFGLFRWWADVSITKKLYSVVGIMAILIATELLTLLFAMNTLSAVRATVAGEGLWTKAQKDSVHSLYLYSLFGDERDYQNYKDRLSVNLGDRRARLELSKQNHNLDIVRQGFIQGGNHPNDVDGMIQLLLRFNQVSYLHDAVSAWTRADAKLDEVRATAEQLHQALQLEGPQSPLVATLIRKIADLNIEIGKEEITFSSSLGAGSRWLESLLMFILVITVITVEGTGLYLVYHFSDNFNLTLKEIMSAAKSVGQGIFTVQAPLRSRDELGQLAEELNKMIHALGGSIGERKNAEDNLKKLNEELERRVLKRTEELEHRESQLRLITNTLPEMVGQVDRNQRFLFANSALCKWIQKNRDQVIGQTFLEVLGEEIYGMHQPHLAKAMTGEIVSFERTVRSKGIPIVFSVTFVPEKDSSGNVVSAVFVANEITKYKQVESDLKQAKLAADIANATKSSFLANMSHEIRTPLGAILGFSELVVNDQLDPAERANTVEIIKRNGEQLSNVINDILDISKVEAGKLEFEMVEVPFERIVSEVQTLLKLKASDKGIRLNVTAAGTMPSVISTDPLRLRQVLLNIVGNAIKFTDQGSVDVQIMLAPDFEGRLKLAFVVKDTGRGIAPEQAVKLFESFTQADTSVSRKFGGTGLGLALSKKLANALGGDVVLKSSTVGIGSTFVVTIDPGRSENIRLQKFDPGSKVVDPLSSHSNFHFSAIKVLVVDDIEDNQALIEAYFRGTGAALTKASNGKEASEMALTEKFDVIFMDLQMPVMDGYEATKKLREKGYQGPIVALTAHAMKDERRRCLEGGFNEQLTKPIRRDLLMQITAQYTRANDVVRSTSGPTANM